MERKSICDEQAEAYKLHTFTATTKAEVKRLKAQVELFRHPELEFYRDAGLQNGMAVLECGCGPGFLIDQLAGQLPQCRFTGLEIDEALLDVFRERIDRNGCDNVVTVKGSIMATGLPDDPF